MLKVWTTQQKTQIKKRNTFWKIHLDLEESMSLWSSVNIHDQFIHLYFIIIYGWGCSGSPRRIHHKKWQLSERNSKIERKSWKIRFKCLLWKTLQKLKQFYSMLCAIQKEILISRQYSPLHLWSSGVENEGMLEFRQNKRNLPKWILKIWKGLAFESEE